jgi:hypothetical protein
MKKQGRFELQVTVDFWDDLLACHFTKKTFREMMRIFRSWGVSRLYWLEYPYASGWWQGSTHPAADKNARRTYEEVGEFTKAAVTYAHEQGIEVYQEFKPFDMGYAGLVPPNFHGTGKKIRGIPALGGYWPWAADFLVEHPEYLMARNMTGIPDDAHRQTVKTIKLVKDDDRGTRITEDSLQLFVSHDNWHYRRYRKPYRFINRIENRPEVLEGVNLNRLGRKQEAVRVITLADLEINEPYFAIANTFKEGTNPDFQNYYYKLVEVYNARSEPVPFTYGLDTKMSAGWWTVAIGAHQFPGRGFTFDCSGDGTNHPGYNLMESIGAMDVPGQVIGLAKGKNPYLPALCPTYPEVRSYWLGMVEEFIREGVDGVEFRWGAHTGTMDWKAYGFNQPIVDEYRKRYGVDIRKDDFDRAKWRKLRGEYYTRFYREAKALLKRHGKKMQVDVSNENYADPALPQSYNIHGDWKTWIKIADAVTLKHTDCNKDIYRDVIKTAQRLGKPTYLCSWGGHRPAGMNKTRLIDLYLKPAKEDGNQGWVFYESGGVMMAKPDGTFDIIMPEVPKIIVPFFKE